MGCKTSYPLCVWRHHAQSVIINLWCFRLCFREAANLAGCAYRDCNYRFCHGFDIAVMRIHMKHSHPEIMDGHQLQGRLGQGGCLLRRAVTGDAVPHRRQFRFLRGWFNNGLNRRSVRSGQFNPLVIKRRFHLLIVASNLFQNPSATPVPSPYSIPSS